MKKALFLFTVSLLVFTSGAASPRAYGLGPEAEPSLKVINGRVKEIHAGKDELVLFYHHPVSGQTEELLLKINHETGFPEGVRLSDFQADEPVTVDYQENPGELPLARLVKRVPVKGVPESLARR